MKREGRDNKFNFEYAQFEMLVKMSIRQLFVGRVTRLKSDSEVISTGLVPNSSRMDQATVGGSVSQGQNPGPPTSKVE